MRPLALLLALGCAACSRGYGSGDLSPSETEAMRAILQEYLIAQEIHYNDHETYTSENAALRMTIDGATLRIVSADAEGHAAVVSHDDHEGAGCAIFVGTAQPAATPGGTVPDIPGVVTCD